MSKFSEDDDALLAELGVEVEEKKARKYTAKEERIIAGFEEIQKFTTEHRQPPTHGEDRDIFERIYAVRLDRLSELEECRKLLEPLDEQGLLSEKGEEEEEVDNEALLEALGVQPVKESIQELKHVRRREEIQAAEEIARSEKCEDFSKFKPLFEQVQQELDTGARITKRFENNADVNLGEFFILYGHKAYLAEMGEEFVNDYGRKNRRLRVIYDNGTESNLLLRSFQAALYKDEVGRRITATDLGPLFSDQVKEGDQPTGCIYVLRSMSAHPEIAQNRQFIHKIGFTTGDVEKRIADAANQATYLLSDVEVVLTYKLYNINSSKLENLIHRIFSNARLKIEINDRFGEPFTPREWFYVPLPVVKEAIEKIVDGSILDYRYDQENKCLKKRR